MPSRRSHTYETPSARLARLRARDIEARARAAALHAREQRESYRRLAGLDTTTTTREA